MDSEYSMEHLIDIVDNDWRSEKFVLTNTESEFDSLDKMFPAQNKNADANRKFADQIFEDAVSSTIELLKDFSAVDNKKTYMEDLMQKTASKIAPRTRSDLTF